jgi:hypothetical protein
MLFLLITLSKVYTLDTTDLFADKEGVYAHASPTTVADNPEHWFEKQPSQKIPCVLVKFQKNL